MAQVVVPLVAKMFVGVAVSKAVGAITGNEVLGAVAGAFVGAGFSLDAATGAASWGNPLAGAAEAGAGAAGATPGVEAATLVDNSLAYNDALVAGGAADTAASMAANVGAGAGATGAAGAGGVLQGAMPSLQTTGAGAGGMLSNATSWMEKNPEITKIGADFAKGMFSPDKIDEIEAQGGQDRMTLAEKQRLELESKQAVDADALKGMLSNVNSNLFAGGYTPAAAVGGGIQQGMSPYSSNIDPNYLNRLNAIYALPAKNEGTA